MRTFILTALLSSSTFLSACSGDDVKYGPEICDNGIDDDGDGALDCDDRDCKGECSETCDDGVDDDGDGLADCADPDCFATTCNEVCGDGEDNDLDGLIDCADVDCAGQCPEACDDNIDNDGDGLADCADSDCASTCDADGDGFFAAFLGYDDCNDGDPAINPAANEVCDEIDNDCDGLIDDEDGDVRGAIYYRDADGDGFGAGSQTFLSCDGQPPNSADNNRDCNDNDPAINPDADEICSLGVPVDEDCNGFIDEDDPGLTSTLTWFVDADGDGYGDSDQLAAEACRPPAATGYANVGDDCDDDERLANPGLSEVICDGIDNDCDITTVDDDGSDDDGDGYIECEGDCDDNDPTANPDGVEITCNGIDEDCDPLTPDDADADRDGYTICDGDCDDTTNQANPGRTERTCDGIDNDCDPVGTPDDPNIDADGDGFTECLGDCDDNDPNRNPDATEITCTGIDEDCDPLTLDDPDVDRDTYSVCEGDCDDDNALANPGRTEVTCDGIDNDCDPYTFDAGDNDGDGFDLCEDDCDDNEPLAFPGNPEVECDGIDNDCDPLTVDDVDVDGDGAGSCIDCDDNDATRSPLFDELVCDAIDNDCDPLTIDDPGDGDGDGFLACVDDCDDTNPDVNPSQAEVDCDGLDNDCNPATDGDADLDGDGYTCADDCNEGDPTINPGAIDFCDDGIDQDCEDGDYTPCDTAAPGEWIEAASVDALAGTFSGTRTLRWSGLNSGHVFCEWVWNTVDWANDPLVAGAPPLSINTCTDADGNRCEFAFAVNAYDGDETDGDCSFVGLVNPGNETVLGIGLGYHADYQVGGASYGPLPMCYFPAPYSTWYGLLAPVDYTGGAFETTLGLVTQPAPY